MKIFGRQIGGIGKKQASLPALQTSLTAPLTLNDSRRLPTRELYTSWVAKCVKAIAEEVGRIELVLYRRTGTKVEVVKEHPMLDTLKFVNEFFTQYTLFERLQANLEIHGNEFWFLERDKRTKLPLKIYPLNPTAVRPIVGKYYVERYDYNFQGATYSFSIDDIVHFKNYSPFSDIVGMSTLEIARSSVETEVFSKEYIRKFYYNDATPGGILSTPDEVNQDKADLIKSKWAESFSGVKRAFKTAVLSGGLTYTTISPKQSDMQFVEQSKLTRDDILALFGVPKTVLGIVEDVNYASAKASNYIFSSRSIYPKDLRIVDQLNEFFVKQWEPDGYWFEAKSPVQEDRFEDAQVNQIKFANGQLTINEWRRHDGLPPVENGDQVFLPFSLTPYARVIEQKSLEVAPTLTKLNEKVKQAVLAGLQVYNVKNGNKVTEDAHGHSEVDGKLEKRFQLRMDPYQFESLGQKVNGQMRVREEPYVKKMEKTMNKLLSDQSQEAIENLKDYMKSGKSVSKKAKLPDFIDVVKNVKVTIDLVRPLIEDFIKLEGEVAFASLGLKPEDFSVDAPNVRKYIESSIKKFAGEITQHTSSIIRQTIADGLESNEGVVAITSRIEQLEGLSTKRSELIAVTEVHRAQGHAEVEAWNQSNVVESKIWYTALDERTCPECSLMHGKEVDLNDHFLDVQGLRDMGYQNYDGPVEIAQLHPRCRCTIIPVIKGQP